MTRDKVYNFAAGPSVMPESALERARDELLDYSGTGMEYREGNICVLDRKSVV